MASHDLAFLVGHIQGKVRTWGVEPEDERGHGWESRDRRCGAVGHLTSWFTDTNDGATWSVRYKCEQRALSVGGAEFRYDLAPAPGVAHADPGRRLRDDELIAGTAILCG
jgi:hypothetical protein